MAIVLVTYNYKGGIGKSTISANLAAGLARVGAKTLLINVDGQNNALRFLNKDFKCERSIYDLLTGNCNFQDIIYPLGNNIDGIPSTDIQEINTIIVENKRSPQAVYEKMFPKAELNKYDYIVFDCGPSESSLNTMVLQSADGIIMPILTEFAGVEAVKNTRTYLAKRGIPEDKIKIVVPNMADKTNGCKMVLLLINQLFSEDVITMPIPRRASVNYAGAVGESIFDYSTDSAIVEPFFNIVEKIVNMKF